MSMFMTNVRRARKATAGAAKLYTWIMNRINKRNLPFVIFGGGALVSVLTILAALSFANPPQCPPYASPDEGCIIGANIGLGLYVLLGVSVWIMASLLSVVFGVRNILSHKKLSRAARILWSLTLAFVVSVVVYAVAAYFLGNVSSFVRS
jgi:hypothetical protein